MIARWDTLSCYGQPPGEYKTQGLMQTADPMPVWIPGSIFMSGTPNCCSILDGKFIFLWIQLMLAIWLASHCLYSG